MKGGWSHLALEEVCIDGLAGAHEDLRPDVGVPLGQPGGRCGWVVWDGRERGYMHRKY